MESMYSSKFGVLFRPEDENPRSLLVLGVTGCGKTTFLERYVEVEYLKGVKVVDIWDSKANLEGAFRVFEPRGKQLKIMQVFNEKVGEKVLESTHYPCKVWMPLSKNLPKKLPSCFEPFTIPLKELGKSDLDFLAEVRRFFMSSVILADLLKKIPKNYTLADFFKELSGLTEYQTADSFFGQKIAIHRQIRRFAMRLFLPFNKEYMISSEVNPLAMTEKRLIEELNDQKTFTVFSTKFIDDKKTRTFVTLWLLNRIAQLKSEGKIKQKIIIVIRDLWTLAPRFFAQEFESTMIQKIFEVLSTFRSKDVEIVADCQDPTTLNLRLSGQFTEVLTGSIFTPSEVSFFAESGSFLDKDVINQIFNLRFKKIKQLYDLLSGEFITIIYPQHKHMEASDNFFDLWRKNYNTYVDFTKIIKESKEELINKINEIKESYRTIEIKKEEPEKEKSIPEQLIRMKRFKRKDVEESLNVSERMAQRMMKVWIKEKKIKKIGKSGSPEVYYKIMTTTTTKKT
jgi:GTPase SAR1 family protein